MSAVPTSRARGSAHSAAARTVRMLALLLMVVGVLMLVAGAGTWITVRGQLADEKITVAEDSDWFAGEPVDGPLTAYAEAQIIEKHALESSGGKTYAELGREDPKRATVMNASFLRASLFTSVVSFGVAAMAMALGAVIALIGYTQMLVARRLAPTPAQPDSP